MPITENIMDNEIVAPFIRRKIAQGRAEVRAEGRVEGLVEGLVEGQLKVLASMIQKRFGRVPPAVRKRLARLRLGRSDRCVAPFAGRTADRRFVRSLIEAVNAPRALSPALTCFRSILTQ
jgi:hypothetical protein